MNCYLKHSKYSVFIVFLILGSAGLSYYSVLTFQTYYRVLFPNVEILNKMYPVASGKNKHQIIYKFQRLKPVDWRSLKDIPEKAVAAILMAEDGTFFQHHGYSPEAIRMAWEHNQKPGVKMLRGGSTITQQVVKNLFLSPEKTLVRKIRELLLSVELERKVSKFRILECYLNIAEWGPGIYGIERASQRYFKKPATELIPREAAVLAFMLPNPIKYQFSLKDGELTKFATKRVETILGRLWKTGQISLEELSSEL